MHADTQGFDLRLQRQAAVIIQLHWHQARGEFHHMSFQAQGLQGVGCFQAEQATTDHYPTARVLGCGLNGVEVGQGAVDQARIAFGTFNRRYEGIGTGGQHQLVVGEAALGGDHFAALAVDLQYRHAEVQGHAWRLVQLGTAEGQGFGIAAGEILGEVHAVIGAQRLFAEHMHAVLRQRATLDQLLDAMMADHAVADDDQPLLVCGGICAVHGVSRPKLIRFFCGNKKSA